MSARVIQNGHYRLTLRREPPGVHLTLGATTLITFITKDSTEKKPEKPDEFEVRAWEARLGFLPRQAFLSGLGHVAVVGDETAVALVGKQGEIHEHRLDDLLSGHALRQAQARRRLGRPWCVAAGFLGLGKTEESLLYPIRKPQGHVVWQGTVYIFSVTGFACALADGRLLWFDPSNGKFLGLTRPLPKGNKGLTPL